MSAAEDERALARAADLSRALDDLNGRLLRAIRLGDAAEARRLLAGPLEVAAIGTLARLRSGDPT